MKDPAILIKNRKELIEDMKDEYGYIFCQSCGVSNSFAYEVHHLIFRSRAPRHYLLHDKINLIILCKDCHAKCHSNNEFSESLINKRNLREIFALNK
jgi:5-methylcytosine-specific restriction endonuclease McrA